MCGKHSQHWMPYSNFRKYFLALCHTKPTLVNIYINYNTTMIAEIMLMSVWYWESLLMIVKSLSKTDCCARLNFRCQSNKVKDSKYIFLSFFLLKNSCDGQFCLLFFNSVYLLRYSDLFVVLLFFFFNQYVFSQLFCHQ